MAILQPSFANGQNAPSATLSQQPLVPSQSAADLSLEKLRLKRSEAEASPNLDKESKDNAIQMLDRAIGFRELLDELNRQSEALSGQIKTAPQRIKAIQSELAQPPPPPEKVKALTAEKDALQLEQLVQREMAQLASARDRLAGWNDQLSKQNNFLEQLPKNTAAAKERLKLANQELQSPTPASDPAAITEYRRLMLRAEQLKLSAEIQLYEQQLNGHELLVSLLTAERDLAFREVARREVLLKEWQAQEADKFQQEAAKAREETTEARDKTPELASAVKNEYDINIALSAQLEEAVRQENSVTKVLENVTNRLQEIEDEFSLATERVKTLMLTETIGLALRRQRQLLPSADKYRRSSAERRQKMGEIREIQFQLDLQRRELTDIDSQTDQIIDSLVYLPPDKAEALRPDVRNLLTDRRQFLEKLQAANNRYFKGLQNLEIAEQQLVVRAEAYADFLDSPSGMDSKFQYCQLYRPAKQPQGFTGVGCSRPLAPDSVGCGSFLRDESGPVGSGIVDQCHAAVRAQVGAPRDIQDGRKGQPTAPGQFFFDPLGVGLDGLSGSRLSFFDDVCGLATAAMAGCA